jgi:hypothetical protein
MRVHGRSSFFGPGCTLVPIGRREPDGAVVLGTRRLASMLADEAADEQDRSASRRRLARLGRG